MLSQMFPGAPKYAAAEEQLGQEDPQMKITGMRGNGTLDHILPPSSGEGWKTVLGDNSNNKIPTDVFNKEGGKNKAEQLLGLSGGSKKTPGNIVNNYFGTKNNKVMDMLGGGSSKKVDSMLGLKKSKKKKTDKVEDMLGGYGKSKNAPQLDEWFFMKKTNTTVSNVLGGFALKPLKPMGVEKKARQHIVSNPAHVGVSRMKKQKGLSPLGDFDGDKVLNAFDCEPRNPKKQAFVHTMPVEVEVTREEGPLLTIETPKTETTFDVGYEKPTPENAPPVVVPPEQPVGPAQPVEEKTGFWTGVKELTKTGIQEIGKTRREKAKFEAEVEKATFKQKAAREAKLRKGRYGYAPRPVRGAAKAIASAPVAFGAGTTGLAQTIAPQQEAQKMAMMTGLYSGTGAYEAVAPSPVPYGVKVDELVGSGELARQWREQPVSQPMPVESTQTPPPTRRATTQPSESGRVWSPFSRRYVTYTRGPYKR